MSIVIFAGPSLPPTARPALPDVIWRTPARMGDIWRAARANPTAIGLIDGYFEVVPAVWHKEILFALDQGIRVIGAASIGALRAAELETFGMIGVGQIYADFRDGVLEDDAEVALLHGPEETGYAGLTEPMVNVRATVRGAVEVGVLSATTANSLITTAQSLYYKDRTWPAIAEPLGRAFVDWLVRGRVDQKRADAIALLAELHRAPSNAAPPRKVFRRTPSAARLERAAF